MFAIALVWIGVAIAFYIYFAMRFLGPTDRMVIYSGKKPVYVAGPGIIFVWPLVRSAKKLDLSPQIGTIEKIELTGGVQLNIGPGRYVYRIFDPMKSVESDEPVAECAHKVVEACLSQRLSQATVAEYLKNYSALEAHVLQDVNSKLEPHGIRVIVMNFEHIDLPREIIQEICEIIEMLIRGLEQGLSVPHPLGSPVTEVELSQEAHLDYRFGLD